MMKPREMADTKMLLQTNVRLAGGFIDLTTKTVGLRKRNVHVALLQLCNQASELGESKQDFACDRGGLKWPMGALLGLVTLLLEMITSAKFRSPGFWICNQYVRTPLTKPTRNSCISGTGLLCMWRANECALMRTRPKRGAGSLECSSEHSLLEDLLHTSMEQRFCRGGHMDTDLKGRLARQDMNCM